MYKKIENIYFCTIIVRRTKYNTLLNILPGNNIYLSNLVIVIIMKA